MKHILTVLAASLLSAHAFAADAPEIPYLGIAYQTGKYDQQGTERVSIPVLRVHMGANVLPNLAIEAQLGVGIGNKAARFSNGLDYDLGMTSFYGAFVRPQLNLGEGGVNIFALAGYSALSFKAKSTAAGVPSFNGSSAGVSYGAGVELGMSKGLRARVDYIHYVQVYSATSLGLTYAF